MEIRAGYKKTDIGAIPFDWQVKELHEICNISRGRFSPRPRNNPIYYGGAIPFVQTGDVTKCNGLITKYTQTLNELGLNVSILFKKGTILMTIAANIGYTGILQLDMACPDSLVAINGISGVSNEFLNFWFIYRRLKIEDLSTSGAQKNLNIELLSPFQVPVPKIEEQCAIVTALSDTDALISSLDKLIAKKRKIKKGAMQEIFKPKKGWGVKSLGSLFEITSSKRVFQSEWMNKGIPFYRARELAVLGESGYVDNQLYVSREMYDAYKKSYGVPKIGDMLVTGVGTLGKTFVVTNDREFYFKDGNIIWFKINGSVNSEFLNQLFKTPIIIKQIEDFSAGTTVGTYTITAANKTLIPYPSIEEQEDIANILLDLDTEIKLLERKLEKLSFIKSGMMQTLLTGKIRLV